MTQVAAAQVPLFVFISMDLETTGLKIFTTPDERDCITEIGAVIAVVFNDLTFQRLGTFSQYVKTNKAISEEVQLVTKITEEKLLKHGIELETAFEKFSAFIHANCDQFDKSVARVMVGQNIDRFDLPMFVSGLEGAELSSFTYMQMLCISHMVDTLLVSRDVVDSTQLQRNAKDGRACYTLSDVYKQVTDKDLVGAHGALADSCAVLELLEHDLFLKPVLADIGSKSPKYSFNFMKRVSEVESKLPKSKANPAKKIKTLEHWFPVVSKQDPN